MKKIILFAAIIFNYAIAQAKCGNNGIICWPSGISVRSNPVFVIDFISGSQNIIPGLNTKHSIYLITGKEKIQLTVSEVNQGEFSVSQVILKPVTELIAGKTYKLVIDNLPKGEQLQRWNEKTGKYEDVQWKVLQGKDTDAPQLTKSPTLASKSMVNYGCGPAKWVYFDFGFNDQSAILIKATVKNTRTGKSTSYFIEHKNNKIPVGHGMCSGAFNFEDENEYEITFLLMDASGYLNNIQTTPIYFTPPTKETKEE